MQVLITKHNVTEHSTFVEVTTGKQSAQFLMTDCRVMVVCMNASHRVWGGLGKTFNSLDDALKAYKSAPMKAMIEVVKDLIAK